MGRLSTFAKNRILNLRFQKSYRIKQIAATLLQEDNIKVSRKSISTFLKKYIETKSINDKPRSGRNKKLTPEEINLIGEVTRLNRDITAPKIKEYLNLNVSTYTILRASKLFEWNKLNPNSNQAKKAAALERQLNGEIKKRRNTSSSSNRRKGTSSSNGESSGADDSNEIANETCKHESNYSFLVLSFFFITVLFITLFRTSDAYRSRFETGERDGNSFGQKCVLVTNGLRHQNSLQDI
jgi:transposase